MDNTLYTVALSQNWENSTNQGWEFYPKLQNKGMDVCGSYSILGSTSLRYRDLNMTKTWTNLPAHQGISLQFYFFQIDDYDGITNSNNLYTVYFKINGQQIPYTVSSLGYNVCGNSSYDSIHKLVLNDPTHSSQTLTFGVHGNRVKFGISNLLVMLTNCPTCAGNSVTY